METCESCRFYFPIDKSGNQGECRFEPPKVFVLPAGSSIAGGRQMIELRSLWPLVKSGAWCGRYEGFTEPLETETGEVRVCRDKVRIIEKDEKKLKLTD